MRVHAVGTVIDQVKVLVSDRHKTKCVCVCRVQVTFSTDYLFNAKRDGKSVRCPGCRARELAAVSAPKPPERERYVSRQSPKFHTERSHR